MVKPGNKKGGKNRRQEASDSEDDLYADENFDPNNPFGDDEIESFHNTRDKQIMDKLKPKGKKKFQHSSDEEEVLAFDDDDEDDESDDDNADIPDEDEEDDEEEGEDEDEDDHDGLDLKGAWGSKKSAYYSGNRIQNDEDAQLEEEEARLLQEKMMKRLDTNDFGLDAFNLISKDLKMKTGDELEAQKLAAKVFGDDDDGTVGSGSKTLEKITKNLTEMSKQEKLDLIQQESPELFELCKEFKAKLNELNEVLLPVFECIQNEQIPRSMATDFIVFKTKLYLMYCCHLSFYFILKANRSSIENHPIIKNILQYRNLCKIISPIDRQLEKEVKFIIDSLKQGRPLSFRKEDANGPAKVKKSVRFRNALAKSKLDDLSFDEEEEDEESGEEGRDEPMEGEVEEEGEEYKKRAINYQIEKNKGLTPKRNKMYRNPRVRNRFKSRKALIKRKSIVPKVRREEKRYGGEMTGIRSNVVRAVKFK